MKIKYRYKRILINIWLYLHKFGIHRWDYNRYGHYNPYRRQCRICHEIQENVCYSWDWERYGFNSKGWWDIIKNGRYIK